VFRASVTWNDEVRIGYYDFVGDSGLHDLAGLMPSHLLLIVRTRAHETLIVRCSVEGSGLWINSDQSDGYDYRVSMDFVWYHPEGALVTPTEYPGVPGWYLVFYIDDTEEGYTPISISHLSSAWVWKGCEVNRMP
jgi:hypothetical protein